MGTDATLPALPLDAWRPTKETLHLVAQMVGKIRLALAPRRNHWWHISLRVTPRGIGSRFVPWKDGAFDVEIDLLDPGLSVRTSRGDRARIPLRDGVSVAEVHRRLFGQLAGLGITPRIWARPYDTPFSTTPFAQDEKHASWDPAALAKFAALLRWNATVLEEVAAGFLGKTSPVHFFWHSFDLAVTRFSGRKAPPLGKDATPVEREAYSHEVASFGFWPGDEDVPAPAYYAYAAPVPDGLTKEPLEPMGAKWLDDPEEGMAVLMLEDVRTSKEPANSVRAFCDSAFRAATKRAKWDAVAPA